MVSTVRTAFATVALLAAAALLPAANAHVYFTNPLAEFKAGASKSSWVAEFPPPWEGVFKTGAQFAAAAKTRGIKDLRSYLEDKGPVCGNSLIDATPKAIPAGGKITMASTIEHAGPCEVWLDDTRAFQNDDCELTFGSATSFTMDFSACKGSCILRFYWLGLQDGGKRWQAYKNCIPLKGSGGGLNPNPAPAPGAAPATDPAPAPAKTNKAPGPAKATKAPAPAKTSKAPEPAPEPAPEAAPTEAPASSSCKRRLRN